MRIQFEAIKVKKKILIQEGCLSVNNQGIYIITGQNGSGKTLLMKNIYSHFEKQMVLVEQENDGIIAELSILENISMTKEEQRNKRIKQLLIAYQLEELLTLNRNKMSGGEKRIICLLRGIFSERKIILIDEPTNDLDYRMVEKLLLLLKDFAIKKLFLIVTHDSSFHSIAKGIFRVKDKQITGSVPSIEKNSESLEKAEGIHDTKSVENGIFNTLWRKNRIGILIVCLIGILAFDYTNKVVHIQDEVIETNLHGNQINLFYSVSNIGIADLNTGAVPIKWANDLLNENVWFHSDKFSKSKYLGSYIEDIQGLELDSSFDYKVYPMEYFNQKDRSYQYSFQTYLTDILGVGAEEGWIDASDIMGRSGVKEVGTRYPFQQELFDKSIEKITSISDENKNTYEATFLTILLRNGYSTKEFLNDKRVIERMDDNIYIQSKETIEVCNQLKQIVDYKQFMKNMLQLGIMLIVIEVLYLCIYLFAKRRYISILYYYGYEKEELKKNILEQQKDQLVRALLVFMLLLYSVFALYGRGKAFIFINYFPVFYTILFAMSSCKLRKKIIKQGVEMFCSWKYR